jgi:tetratricopeptide (TPR) repeat protein
MSPAECAELAHELGHPVNSQNEQQLYEQSHGNPLFLREVLAQHKPGTASFQDLLEARLALLSFKERTALQAAAVLGREFRHGRWQALVGKDLLDAIPGLIAARFILETESGYQFQHDLTREQIYRAIPPDRLQALHCRAAEVLKLEGVGMDELAWHFEQAEDWIQAVSGHIAAGDQSLKDYAYTTALDHYNHALKLLPQLSQPDTVRLALLCRRQRVLGILLRIREWREDVDEIDRMSSVLNDSPALLEGLEARLNLQAVDGDLNLMVATGKQALAQARELDNPAAEARISLTIGRHLRTQAGQAARALPYFQRAAELAENLRDFPLLVSTLSPLATAQLRTGQCSAARAAAGRALAIIEQNGNLTPLRPEVLHRLAEVSHYLGEWEIARSMLRQAMQQLYALGKLWEMGEVSFEFTITCAEMGQSQDALQTVEFVLSLAAQTGMNIDQSNVIQQFKVLSAYTHLLAGRLQEAELELKALAHLLTEPVETMAGIECLFVWGLLCLAQGQPEAAARFLVRSIELSPPEIIAEAVISLLGSALAFCQMDNREAAQARLAQAEQLRARSDATRFDVLLHFTRFQVSGRVQDLQAARAELQRQAALFTDDQLRADFMDQVYWHRLVETSWQEIFPTLAPQVVRLARANAPTGRPLAEKERVDVFWTVDDGEQDAETLRHKGKVALRRRRLRRLVSQAQAQGAAPTQRELARAIGVTERTIRRDLFALEAEGQPVFTRGRKDL